MSDDQPQPSRGLVSRIGRKLKKTKTTPDQRRNTVDNTTKRQPQRLQKRNASQPFPDRQEGINELGERTYSIWSETSTLVDEVRRDHTDMIHGLAHHGSFDSLIEGTRTIRLEEDEEVTEAQMRRIGRCEARFKKVSSDVWQRIASFLNPADAAILAVTSKTLLEKLGLAPLDALTLPENQRYRISFLNHLDRHLPNHLLCYPCATYHRRFSRDEKLKADFINNPLYLCPKVFSTYLPRMRLTQGRELPYSFIQLATRHAHSRHHGIHADRLSRRWKDASGWSHQSRYTIHDGRLLMRIRSQIFAPPCLTPTAERMLLYDREDYIPFFSVCKHWQNGELMRLCKCALSHVPGPHQSTLDRIRESPNLKAWVVKPGFVARQCDECRPARRCPECPTEYLIEITMAEDKNDPVCRFKHVLVVTRWSDLGDGSSPTSSPEYCAINGVKVDEGYDSFSHVGRRAVAGIFESKVSGCIPGQRMISLNPKNEKLGEAGHGWY
ncbi:hypothetical protein BDV96DRAFT_586118 [Lophiotrema nucula]|uniref:Uncharacterized protein n=1 Tax=Lophiotrema nucula TaxID=690887 RepID=A0A6A5YT65_9PLEO|nr:hypothetical protein BDV96DRAFT_586118 [Lophiotrema nucula]